MDNTEKLKRITNKLNQGELHHLLQVKGGAWSDIDLLLQTIFEQKAYINHPDLLILKTENALYKMEDLTEVFTFTKYSANQRDNKILVISQAEKINEQAANKLLKLFEEPPIKMHIILFNPLAKPLINTIESRCISLVLANNNVHKPELDDSMDLVTFTKEIQSDPELFFHYVESLAHKNLDYDAMNMLSNATSDFNTAIQNYTSINAPTAVLFELMQR
jgi:hypothetical protein